MTYTDTNEYQQILAFIHLLNSLNKLDLIDEKTADECLINLMVMQVNMVIKEDEYYTRGGYVPVRKARSDSEEDV